MGNEDHLWPELAQLVSLIVQQQTSTRAELARITGLARSTVSQRIDELLSLGVLIEAGDAPSSGGRRPTLLALNPAAGVVLAADLGATHVRVAMATLGGQPEAERGIEIGVAESPDSVLAWLIDRFYEMLEEKGRSLQDVKAIGMCVPGLVEFATGTVVHALLQSWDGVVLPELFSRHFEVPVFVDNDANVMGLGEYWSRGLVNEQLLFVKVATGIGCGIIADGQVHRGADGAAGDIGHVRVAVEEDAVCSCGNLNCLEAVASGAALARQLSAQGLAVQRASDVVRLSRAGDARALRLVHVAGQRIGEVLASLVTFYNPRRIIVGGALAVLQDTLLSGMRSVIHEQAPSFATRRLTIETTACGHRSAVLGATILGAHGALSAGGISDWVRVGRPSVLPGLPSV
jgi:predicted NBD/HSP70 family sugar kinase